MGKKNKCLKWGKDKICVGDKIKAVWFDDPKWYTGKVKYSKSEKEMYLDSPELKKENLYGGLNLADDIKKIKKK